MTREVMQMALDWANNHGEIVFAGGGMKAVDGMNAWSAEISTIIKSPEKTPSPWHPLNGDGKGFEGHVLMRHVNGELDLSHSNWTGPELCQSSKPAYRVMREYGYRHWMPIPAFTEGEST